MAEMAGMESSLRAVLFGSAFLSADGKAMIRHADIRQPSDIYAWVSGAILDPLYASTWYNGDAMDANDRGFLSQSNRIVGGVQLRQLRVKQSCDTDGDIKSYPSFARGVPCEPVYSSGKADTSAFTTTNSLSGASTTWTYSDGDELLFNREGRISDYPGGGFAVYLPFADEAASRATVSELSLGRWVDDQTAAVLVSFTSFNFNEGLFAYTEVLFEMGPQGVVWSSVIIRPFQSSTLGKVCLPSTTVSVCP